MVDLTQAAASHRVNGVDRKLIEKTLVDKRRQDVAGDDGNNTGATEQEHRPVSERVPAKDPQGLRSEVISARGYERST